MRSSHSSWLYPLPHSWAGTPVCPALPRPLLHCRTVRKPALSTLAWPQQLQMAWQHQRCLRGEGRQAHALHALLTVKGPVMLQGVWQDCNIVSWEGSSALASKTSSNKRPAFCKFDQDPLTSGSWGKGLSRNLWQFSNYRGCCFCMQNSVVGASCLSAV